MGSVEMVKNPMVDGRLYSRRKSIEKLRVAANRSGELKRVRAAAPLNPIRLVLRSRVTRPSSWGSV